jgi:hypothetical protein
MGLLAITNTQYSNLYHACIHNWAGRQYCNEPERSVIRESRGRSQEEFKRHNVLSVWFVQTTSLNGRLRRLFFEPP